MTYAEAATQNASKDNPKTKARALLHLLRLCSLPIHRILVHLKLSLTASRITRRRGGRRLVLLPCLNKAGDVVGGFRCFGYLRFLSGCVGTEEAS
jgi:hypothetical protein